MHVDERMVNLKTGTKLALVVALFVLIGFPIIFTFISMMSDNWNYLFYSLPGSFTAGFTGLSVTLHHKKKERAIVER
jgi:hypothetical protein